MSEADLPRHKTQDRANRRLVVRIGAEGDRKTHIEGPISLGWATLCGKAGVTRPADLSRPNCPDCLAIWHWVRNGRLQEPRQGAGKRAPDARNAAPGTPGGSGVETRSAGAGGEGG